MIDLDSHFFGMSLVLYLGLKDQCSWSLKKSHITEEILSINLILDML